METIREAQVISLADPDEVGRIQVRILPEMLDFRTQDLPWATKYALGTGISINNGIHELPEVDSFIRVLIEDWPYLKRIRYISDDYVEGLYIYSKFTSIVSIDELGTQSYPQPFFKCYKDGTIEFHNSETSEHGVFYKGGGYFLQDADGNMFTNSKTKGIKSYNDNGSIELKADGKVELNGNSKQFVTWSELDAAFNQALTGYIALLNISLTTTPIIGNGTPQASWIALPTSVNLASAKTTTVLTGG